MQPEKPPLAVLAELWAKLYYAFAIEILEDLGDERGWPLLRACIRRYGRIRGEAVRQYVESKGLPITKENFVRYYDMPFAAVQRASLPLYPGAALPQSEGVTFCPYKEVWERLPRGREIGLAYCEEFHKAMWAAYHPKLRVRQDQIMLRGDRICTFETYFEGETESIKTFEQKTHQKADTQ
ncbi:MAG TPA: hypothetical protein EYP09_02735 [Anaerolineae bacterium]|nr:hypothetical protein [Anaerolineae bacterium]